MKEIGHSLLLKHVVYTNAERLLRADLSRMETQLKSGEAQYNQDSSKRSIETFHPFSWLAVLHC
jgi:hypothetical protein